MHRPLVAIITVAIAALAVGAAAGIRLAGHGAQPVKKVAVCYGVGCRGQGRDPAALALHSTCLDTLRYRETACPASADFEPPVSEWYRHHSKGDLPSLSSWSAGQREATATY